MSRKQPPTRRQFADRMPTEPQILGMEDRAVDRMEAVISSLCYAEDLLADISVCRMHVSYPLLLNVRQRIQSLGIVMDEIEERNVSK